MNYLIIYFKVALFMETLVSYFSNKEVLNNR